MKKNFKELEFGVKVPGTDFVLRANKTYRIIGRTDESAPDGYKERGITKYEHPLNGQNGVMHFDSQRKLWDTGLYNASPCYSKVKPEEIEETVKALDKNLKPYLEQIYEEGVFENNRGSNKYWDSYKFGLNQNLTISTNSPENFFGLWTSLLHGAIAPEDEQKNPKYRELGTPYVLVNSAEKSSNKQKNTFAKNEAISSFIAGIKKDKDHLIDVLKYVGFNAASETSDNILNSTFTNWLENKNEGAKNAGYFNNAIDKFKSKSGKEELAVWNMLNKAVKKGKITHLRGEFFIGEDSIGNNLKTAAEFVNNDDKLKGQLFELAG